MRKEQEIESSPSSDEEPRGTGPSSSMCKPLLDAATPDLFAANAFRITGLPVDATTREITKQADKLKMMEKLGQGKSVHTGAFALKNPPTVDEIRDAIQKLKDPELRIIDEIFWFWPQRFGQSASDPALQALAAGDADAPLEIWTRQEADETDSFVGRHNIAVLWHLTALDKENQYATAAEFTEESMRQTEKLWRGAFKRWELLAVDDVFWESVSTRIQHLDDPRLTTGFARRMRVTLPHALDKVNAELALRYAESDRMDLARVHVQFMRETNQGHDNVERTAELVLAPAKGRLKQQIQRARDRAAEKPGDAFKTARELLQNARRSLALFELFFGKKSEERNELSDEVAALCNQLSVSYQTATGDNQACIDLLKAALPFATSIDIRQQIENNIGILTGNLTIKQLIKQLEPINAILKRIQESKEHPSSRLDRFRTEFVPALLTVSASVVGSQAYTDICDSAAIVLRGISLAAWNDHHDIVTAEAANELAHKHVRETELKQRLIDDRLALSTQRAAQQLSRKQNSVSPLVIMGYLVVVIGVVTAMNWKRPSSASVVPRRVIKHEAARSLPYRARSGDEDEARLSAEFRAAGETVRLGDAGIYKGASNGTETGSAPKQETLDAKDFSVTSILLGIPSIAVINGRAYSEGEYLRAPKQGDHRRIRVQRITDATVTLQYKQEVAVVLLRRAAGDEVRPDEQKPLPDKDALALVPNSDLEHKAPQLREHALIHDAYAVAATPIPSTPAPRVHPPPATPVPSTATPTGQRLRVVNVKSDDYLKLREIPDQSGTVVAQIAAAYQPVLPLGAAVQNGPDFWIPVKAGEYRGYVNSKFVAPVR